MAPKEPTRAQLSSRLSYSQNTPSFLLKLQNRIAGIPDEDDDEDEDEYDESGRPPIPRRPAIPERPEDDPGSADEDNGDEKPQVVVLKEGKHLTEREAENIRRKEKGLAPLSDPKDVVQQADKPGPVSPSKEATKNTKATAPSLSFSSSKGRTKPPPGKRKAVGDPEEVKNSGSAKDMPAKKKSKKPSTALLSFGEDA
ncbi:hypothetical protein L208DRAFT_1376365 [Tricholoma matsutake]|nr:hypothetical protein L208DRAFT_1376365 [Tricholoma matsutake 945]